MKVIPFSPEEIALAVVFSQKELNWIPKSSDWFIDLNNVKVNYKGEYTQSVSLCLVTDEDGRSFSFLELIIDGEENGNRMKKSISYKEKEVIGNMVWLPNIKDCLDIIKTKTDYKFVSLENDKDYKVTILDLNNSQVLYYKGVSELEALYKCINALS